MCMCVEGWGEDIFMCICVSKCVCVCVSVCGMCTCV